MLGHSAVSGSTPAQITAPHRARRIGLHHHLTRDYRRRRIMPMLPLWSAIMALLCHQTPFRVN